MLLLWSANVSYKEGDKEASKPAFLYTDAILWFKKIISFTNRVIPIWNSLPNHVVSADTINTFKNRLDKFWSDQEVLYDYMCRNLFLTTANWSTLEKPSLCVGFQVMLVSEVTSVQMWLQNQPSVQPFQLWSVLPLTCIRVSLTIVRDFGR